MESMSGYSKHAIVQNDFVSENSRLRSGTTAPGINSPISGDFSASQITEKYASHKIHVIVSRIGVSIQIIRYIPER